LIRITSRVDLALTVCLFVRMNAEISETIRTKLLGLGMQIPELLTQRIMPKSVYRQHNHILRSRVGGAFQSRLATCISPFPFGPFS